MSQKKDYESFYSFKENQNFLSYKKKNYNGHQNTQGNPVLVVYLECVYIYFCERYFLPNYCREHNYYSVTTLSRSEESREKEREREGLFLSIENLEQIIVTEKGYDFWTVWCRLDASSAILYAQQDMFMKKLVFTRENFSGSWIVIYASFSHASTKRCLLNIEEKCSICLYWCNTSLLGPRSYMIENSGIELIQKLMSN